MEQRGAVYLKQLKNYVLIYLLEIVKRPSDQ